jgi:hypothetical protein
LRGIGIFLTNLSSFRVPIILLNIQITRVNVIKFLVLFIPAKSIGTTNLLLQDIETFALGEIIEISQTKVEDVDIQLDSHGAPEKSTPRIAFRIVETIVWQSVLNLA